MGKVDSFGFNSDFPQNIVYVVVSYYVTELPFGDAVGQISVPIDANQSETQFINDLKNTLADHVNATLGTSLNIADVMGCSL